MVRELFEMKEQPPLGEVPGKMYAWTVRPERFGEPKDAWKLEVVDIPDLGDYDVLVYVMAAGINYNNVWAGLGVPINVIGARNKAGEKEEFHIGGSDASGIVYKVGKKVTNVKVGDEVVMHCGQWDPECPHVQAGGDPMYSLTFRIWGYETNFGSFAQFTRVRADQCLPKPRHLTWEEAAAYMLVGATAYRMLLGWAEHAMQKDDVVLIWGGAGGLGSMAIQIARAKGAIPVAVVSSDDKFDYCKQLGAAGVINRKKFDHWGMLPHWKDKVGYARWLKGVRTFGRAIWDELGEKKNPRIVFEHPGESTIPTSMFVCETGGNVVICAGTTGYNATVDLRYMWMRQKRLQGSHFANAEQSAAFNDLVIEGLVDPCLSKTFTHEQVPDAHQLMYENKHPYGNMALLIGAPEMGMGASSEPKQPRAQVMLDDSVPEETYVVTQTSIEEPVNGSSEPKDEMTVGEVMRPDVVTCTSSLSVRDAARMLHDHDVQGMVVTDEDGWALGVVSQTDVVLARQGRTDKAMDQLKVRDIMTPHLLSCRADDKVSEAVTQMTSKKIHRLIVVEEHGDKVKAVGLMSMRAIVRRMVGAPQPGESSSTS